MLIQNSLLNESHLIRLDGPAHGIVTKSEGVLGVLDAFVSRRRCQNVFKKLLNQVGFTCDVKGVMYRLCDP